MYLLYNIKLKMSEIITLIGFLQVSEIGTLQI